MPCAGPDYSCNSLIKISSPVGEMRIGAPNSDAPSPRPIWLFAKAYLVVREWFAHRGQRRALRELDERLLDDIAVSKPDAFKEGHKFL
jgi:uncharacterized protein YjiS (DUF1127 family)